MNPRSLGPRMGRAGWWATGGLGLVFAAASFGQPLFGNPQWRSLSDASAVACGFIDEDSTLDMVVANSSDQSVSVFLTDAECELFEHASVSLGYDVDCVAVGDVDGDDHPDIITAHAEDGKIGVLLNNGDGTFPDPAPEDFYDATSPHRLALVDLDHDPETSLDIIAADRDGDQLQILYNDGSGVFGPASGTSAGTTQLGVASEDLDGDGWSDVAVCNYNPKTVSILLNDQSGNLSLSSSVSLDSYPNSVAIGNLDVDAYPDLAIACDGEKVVTAANSGVGSFTVVDQIDVTGSPVWIAAGDLDGDSDLDLATANKDTDLTSILLNNGDATFSVALELNTNREPTCVTIADLDNDTDAEIVLAHAADTVPPPPPGGWVSVLVNDDDVWFRSFELTGTTTQPVGPALADVDQDGHVDAIVGSAHFNEFVVHPGNGTATFDPATTYTLGAEVRGLVAADLDNDLDVDLAMSLDVEDGSFHVVVYENDSGSFVEAWRSEDLSHAPTEILAGLLDTDAYPDLAIEYSGALGVFYSQGSCQFDNFATSPDHETADIALGDFNGDDALDVLAAGPESGYYENDGIGGFGSYTKFEVGDPAEPIEAHLAAVWQGYQPILINRDTKVMRVVHYSGSEYYTDNYPLGPDPTDVLCADLDAGFGQELLVTDADDGSVYSYRFRLDSAFGFVGPTPYAIGPNPQGLAAGDVDGDGYPDLVIQNGLFDGLAANLQLPPKCPADLNVDGKTNVFDFAIFVQNFGTESGATRQMGDFNNDGKINVFDFAVFAINFGCEV